MATLDHSLLGCPLSNGFLVFSIRYSRRNAAKYELSLGNDQKTSSTRSCYHASRTATSSLTERNAAQLGARVIGSELLAQGSGRNFFLQGYAA